MALRLTQLLTEMSTRNISWGVKAGGVYGWQPYHLQAPIVFKSGRLIILEPSGPVQACNGIALTLHLPTGLYWHVMPWSFVTTQRRFGGLWCLHIPNRCPQISLNTPANSRVMERQIDPSITQAFKFHLLPTTQWCSIYGYLNLQAPCVLYIGQAFRYSPENAFYIFNQQTYFIIWYLLDRASLI